MGNECSTRAAYFQAKLANYKEKKSTAVHELARNAGTQVDINDKNATVTYLNQPANTIRAFLFILNLRCYCLLMKDEMILNPP